MTKPIVLGHCDCGYVRAEDLPTNTLDVLAEMAAERGMDISTFIDHVGMSDAEALGTWPWPEIDKKLPPEVRQNIFGLLIQFDHDNQKLIKELTVAHSTVNQQKEFKK